MEVHANFLIARAVMSSEVLEEALMFPKQRVSLDVSTQNIMSVDVPQLNFVTETGDETNIYPYGFATTSGELMGQLLRCLTCCPICLNWRKKKNLLSF
jgi:V/A-type H+-transporting ATPase subunit D